LNIADFRDIFLNFSFAQKQKKQKTLILPGCSQLEAILANFGFRQTAACETLFSEAFFADAQIIVEFYRGFDNLRSDNFHLCKLIYVFLEELTGK
jgi:hypothetical protein